MDCKTAHDLLPLYFDGELDRATSREFEAHVDACAECRAALVELDDLRNSLREHTPRYVAPASLRERIANSASAANGKESESGASPIAARRSRRALPPPLRFAAAVALAFAAGGTSMSVWNSTQSSTASRAQVTRDLFASHWRALAATSPVDVVSTDRHTVKPWFAGKVADAPLVQDFADQGFPLIGGRIDYIGSSRVPVLVYRHGQHLIDVFVLAQADAASGERSSLEKGYRIEPVRLGDQPAAIVTDMDAGELAKFEQLLAQSK
jgi:anti-sigma factor RsiW